MGSSSVSPGSSAPSSVRTSPQRSGVNTNQTPGQINRAFIQGNRSTIRNHKKISDFVDELPDENIFFVKNILPCINIILNPHKISRIKKKLLIQIRLPPHENAFRLNNNLRHKYLTYRQNRQILTTGKYGKKNVSTRKEIVCNKNRFLQKKTYLGKINMQIKRKYSSKFRNLK